MEHFKFTIAAGRQTYNFEGVDFPHHDDQGCRFEVFQHGELIASFEPDKNEVVRICNNPGKVDRKILHLIAEHLEAYQV